MVVLNAGQGIGPELVLFSRLAWNDGRTEPWIQTEMGCALSASLSLGGGHCGRPADTVGLDGNIGGRSGPHQRFMRAGGTGFILCDGRLNYRPERMTELYDDARVAPGTNPAGNVPLVNNAAQNADRGPIRVLSLRLGTSF